MAARIKVICINVFQDIIKKFRTAILQIMKIKGLLFDNDGVLTHTEHVFYRVNKKVFESLDIPYTKKILLNTRLILGLVLQDGC